MVLIRASKMNRRHFNLDGWTLKDNNRPHSDITTIKWRCHLLYFRFSPEYLQVNFYFLYDLVNGTFRMGLALCLWSHSRVWPSSLNYTSNSKTYNTNATFALRTHMHARTQRGTHRHLRPPISLSIRLALTLTGFREIAGLSCGRWGEQ